MHSVRRKKKWALAAVLGLILAVIACAPATAPTPTPTKTPAAATPTAAPKAEGSGQSPAKPTAKPLRIGVMNPLTGPLAVAGKLAQIGYDMAAEDINKAGGINGSPVELVTYDTKADPREAMTVFRKLALEDKVAAVMGPFSGSEFDVVAPLANELKVLSASQAVKYGLAAQNRPWAFQILLQSTEWWPQGVEAFKKKYPGIKKVTLGRDVKYASTEWEGKVLLPKLLADAGLELAGSVEWETGTKDWAAIATKIKDLGAEGLFVTGVYPDAPGLFKELGRLGYKPKVAISNMFMHVSVLWTVPEALEGAVVPYWVDWTRPDPKLQDFVARWKTKAAADQAIPKPPAGGYDLFPTNEVAQYDSLMAIAEAARKAGITGSSPLEEAREKIRDGYAALRDYPGLVGKISVLPTGDVKWPITVFTIEGAKPKALD
ncbi:MAG: ABC transporter substrate-binding protein [Dehalococcoidia bacterium]|nr:ABC transporter substrate-binding protein [Dehalococcoidia bacterium]